MDSHSGLSRKSQQVVCGLFLLPLSARRHIGEIFHRQTPRLKPLFRWVHTTFDTLSLILPHTQLVTTHYHAAVAVLPQVLFDLHRMIFYFATRLANSSLFVGGIICVIAVTFSGSGFMPSLLTVSPRNVNSVTSSSHFSFLRDNSDSRHLSRILLTVASCCSLVEPHMMMTSIDVSLFGIVSNNGWMVQ